MAKPPITDVVNKWNQRLGELSQQGIDTQPFQDVAKKDIQRVQHGGTGMSNLEARSVAMSILSGGRQPFDAPKRPTGLFGTIGNVVPDVTDIAKGLWHVPINVFKEGQHIVQHPQDVAKPFTMHTKGSGLSAFAERVRAFSQTPGLDLIPTTHTLAGLTTSEGRKELQRHPVGTLVDVLPAEGKAAKFAGTVIGKSLGKTGAKGSALEALQAGHTLKAAYRTLPEVTRESVQQFLKDHNIARQDYEAGAAYQVANRKSIKAGLKIRDSQIIDTIRKMPEEERLQLTEEAKNYRPGMNISPEHEHIIKTAKQLQIEIADASEGRLVRISHNGHELIYPAESDVGRAHLRKLEAERKIGNATTRFRDTVYKRLESEHRRIDYESQKVDGRIERLKAERERLKERINKHQGKTTTAGKRQLQKAQMAEAVNQLHLRKAFAEAKDLEEQRGTIMERDPQIKTAKLGVERAKKASLKAHETFTTELQKSPPGSFDALMERDKIQAGLKLINQRGNFRIGVDEAIKRLKRHDVTGLMSEEDWQRITDDVNSHWQDYEREGFDPVWVMNVEEHGVGKAMSSRILPTDRPKVVEHTINDLKPGVSDLAVALSAELMQWVRLKGSEAFVTEHLSQHLQTAEEVSNDLNHIVDLRASKGKLRSRNEASELARLRDERYVEFDPEKYGTTRAQLTGRLAGTNKLYLPKDIDRTLDSLHIAKDENIAERALTSSTHVFKASVMGFSAKHMAHIVLGGTVFMMGRGGLAEIQSFADAARMIKDGSIPAEIMQLNDIFSPHDLMEFHTGGTLGRILNTGWEHSGKPVAERIATVEQTITQWQRAVSFLGEQKRQLRHGATPEAAREAGLEHAYKTLVDLDHMSPLERTTIKRVMPFYAYTRHILRYALTYPIDYPIRAAIITRLAEMEMKDRNTSLPQSFENLFFLGTPDAKGHVSAVDVRPTNPFRDLGTTLTFAGLIRSLNPALGGLFAMAGVKTLTGTPDLYPELTVDPNTGGLIAKRPPNGWFTYAKGFVPELQTVDDIFKVTHQTRQMYQNQPDALWNRLYASLFIPFGVRNISMSNIEATAQINREKMAQAAVSQALKGQGDVSHMGAVPYEGQLVQGKALQDFINSIQTPSGYAPKAVIPKRRTRTR